eukprot:scaffold853_cov386-Prasinococcus_capsulatus_cf.AAC.8
MPELLEQWYADAARVYPFSRTTNILSYSINAQNKHVWKRLQVWIKDGRLEIMQSCEVVNGSWDGVHYTLHVHNHQELDKVEPLIVDHLWMATGSSVDVMSDKVRGEMSRSTSVPPSCLKQIPFLAGSKTASKVVSNPCDWWLSPAGGRL